MVGCRGLARTAVRGPRQPPTGHSGRGQSPPGHARPPWPRVNHIRCSNRDTASPRGGAAPAHDQHHGEARQNDREAEKRRHRPQGVQDGGGDVRGHAEHLQRQRVQRAVGHDGAGELVVREGEAEQGDADFVFVVRGALSGNLADIATANSGNTSASRVSGGTDVMTKGVVGSVAELPSCIS